MPKIDRVEITFKPLKNGVVVNNAYYPNLEALIIELNVLKQDIDPQNEYILSIEIKRI